MADSMVQLYRSSYLCDSLMDAMEELMAEGKIDQELGMKVLANYDQSIMAALSKRAEAKASLTVLQPSLLTACTTLHTLPHPACETSCLHHSIYICMKCSSADIQD